jgi:hypothetical protein
MFLPYVSRQVVTTGLPKRFVKSLRYINILCSQTFHEPTVNNGSKDSGNFLAKKESFAAKTAKNVEFRLCPIA